MAISISTYRRYPINFFSNSLFIEDVGIDEELYKLMMVSG